MHEVPAYCGGEICGMCLRAEESEASPATHKVGEESQPDDEIRHNWTQYVCCKHFQLIFGLGAECWPQPMIPRTLPNVREYDLLDQY